MKELEPRQLPLLARVQKVRARMHIEGIPGVCVDNRVAFLAACYKYEQEPSFLVYDTWHKEWEDWTDWHKW